MFVDACEIIAENEGDLAKERLTIITPCSRPHNLQRLAESIRPGRLLFDVVWLVVFDFGECEKSKVGNYQRNCALDAIESGWVYFLDDDTVMHLDFFRELAKVKKEAVAFEQDLGNGIRPVSPERMRVQKIDMGQVAIRREVIGNTRFELGIYEADGIFIETVYNRDPARWEFLHKPLTYYNALRR